MSARWSSNLCNLAICVSLMALTSTAQTASTDRASLTVKLVAAANERAKHVVLYDGSYQKIAYPGGDVAANKGACTDEIIRIYRTLGIDLQKEVHEDIVKDRSAYPFKLKWASRRTDTNIDHRRVENLNVFFKRHGENLPITPNEQDYLPGDIVSWDLGGGVTHIGMVVDQRAFLVGPYVQGPAQHRLRAADRRCSVQLEGHRSFSLFRPQIVCQRNSSRSLLRREASKPRWRRYDSAADRFS